MPLIISISASAAAIFSADEGCGRPPNIKDILRVRWDVSALGRLSKFYPNNRSANILEYQNTQVLPRAFPESGCGNLRSSRLFTSQVLASTELYILLHTTHPRLASFRRR